MEWRAFISKSEANALGVFRKPKRVTESLLEDESMKAISQVPKEFLAEWHGKKVLKRPDLGNIQVY